MKILLLDNYDSFTYNLVDYLEQNQGVSVTVIRNDELNLDQLADFDRLVISPGPGLPEESGMLMEVIEKAHQSMPIFGVCLGLQALGMFFGAQLENLDQVIHGESLPMEILDHEDPLYKSIPSPCWVGHYHSWALASHTIPDDLIVTGRSESGVVMSFRHRELPIWAVQFHPESVLTPHGLQMIKNWIEGTS
ncbi:aminodeoxychorismate/anthranilate synthase component II [bacterium SCSIO 12741]|nr:aminodeoxychorismate/anthranilate synthase component II [bacterium SCSIO 12741]